MSLWFLLFLLLGIAVMVYGAVMFAFGKRRNAGITFGVAAILLGISAPIGVLIGDGAPVAASSETASTASSLTFSYPAEAEKLDAQDYLLTGNGKPLEPLEVLQNGVSLGQIAAGADGAWSYYVAKPAVGEYEFEVKGTTGSIKRQISVQQGLTSASNAQCPCQLRIVSDINQNIPNAKAVLYKDGLEVVTGIAPVVFRDLTAGDYTYTLEADGFVTSKPAAATLPKNKNLSAYLEQQK
jgi:hypothetical protein